MLPSERLLSRLDHHLDALDQLDFSDPVAAVYNPLRYARAMWELYLRRFGNAHREVLVLGMNPGPWGMAQTGIPFGEVGAVRDWMGLAARIGHPEHEHPKRPVEGLNCRRSEVSGRRLWGLFRERFGAPQAFFDRHLVINYCPLVFMGETGRNITPDKLSRGERSELFAICDAMLAETLAAYRPKWLVGVGAFATARLSGFAADDSATSGGPRLVQVLHPSPASPAANRGWAEQASRQLEAAGVWEPAS